MKVKLHCELSAKICIWSSSMLFEWSNGGIKEPLLEEFVKKIFILVSHAIL